MKIFNQQEKSSLLEDSPAVFEKKETSSKVKIEWTCTNVTTLVGSKIETDTLDRQSR